MSQSYITLSRAKEALRSNFYASDDAILTDIIASCSAFLDNFANVPEGSFLTTNLDVLVNGTGSQLMFLDARPVQAIQRIATAEQPALLVHNTDSDMGCRATVSVNATGVVLTYIKNAITTTNTFLFATYPTVQQLSDAIGAVGHYWTSYVQNGFGGWSSADLRPTQGAYGARVVSAYLWVHWIDLPNYRINELTGEIYNPSGFTRGVFNWRINYTAGYTTLPYDLQQALAELVAQTYYIREANANMASESLDGAYSYNRLTTKGFEGLSDMARRTLGQYKRRTINKFSTW